MVSSGINKAGVVKPCACIYNKLFIIRGKFFFHNFFFKPHFGSKNKTRSYVNFCSKRCVRAHFQGIFCFSVNNILHLIMKEININSNVITFRSNIITRQAQLLAYAFHRSRV